ncbi:hypothetical protein X798_08129, partial [Onchocerca flexuosa]
MNTMSSKDTNTDKQENDVSADKIENDAQQFLDLCEITNRIYYPRLGAVFFCPTNNEVIRWNSSNLTL